MDEHWKSDLENWLAPFLGALRHKARARMCPAYVAGLIGAGDRKSIQPMAARDDGVGYDQLHHFIAGGVWDHVPDAKSVSAEKRLATAPWRMLSWRRGTKGSLKARFAAVRIRVADGPPQRIGDMGQQHLPGEEAWLIGEHRSNGERKYYLSNLPAGTSLKRLAGAIKGALDMRASASATEGGTRTRSLRGTIMDGAAPARAHDHDRLCLPPVPAPQTGEAGKKESRARHLSRPCQRSARPSSPSSNGHRQHDVRTAADRSALTICQSSVRLRTH